MSGEREAATRWLSSLEAELAGSGIATCLTDDVHWRDLVVFTGSIEQHRGRDVVSPLLAAAAGTVRPRRLRPALGFTEPQWVHLWGRRVLEVVFEFDLEEGTGLGVARLIDDPATPAGARAWLLLTSLRSVARTPRSVDLLEHRYGYRREQPSESWSDHRQRRRAFEDREPDVLVVGAGHSGQMLAAQLLDLGVDALVVDAQERVGDVWRHRYHSLALHNPTTASHFPFLAFPAHFPPYLSKDQLANWLEVYAEAMSLPIWSSTELVSASFDPQENRWQASVRRDGGARTLRPRHVVMAVGAFGNVPRRPRLAGLKQFGGEVLHTSEVRTFDRFSGARALVVGVGSSGHDTALELLRRGAEVTMLQRGPVDVVDLATVERYPWVAAREGATLEEHDLIAAANMVFPVARQAMRETAAAQRERDRDLLAALADVGFRTEAGANGGGWQLQAWRTGGGYYINVGASDAIADGRISVLQSDAVGSFEKAGLQRHGENDVLPLDVVILATGFENASSEVARIFGADVASAIGPIFSLDDHGVGEWSNTWVPTSQPHLWFTAGGLAQSRPYSRYLALQLAAATDASPGDAAGAVPSRPERP